MEKSNLKVRSKIYEIQIQVFVCFEKAPYEKPQQLPDYLVKNNAFVKFVFLPQK